MNICHLFKYKEKWAYAEWKISSKMEIISTFYKIFLFLLSILLYAWEFPALFLWLCTASIAHSWCRPERSWLTRKDKKRCNESWNKAVLFNKTLSELSFHMKNWPFKQKWPAEFLHRKEAKFIGAYTVIILLFHDTMRLNETILAFGNFPSTQNNEVFSPENVIDSFLQ